MAAPGKRQAFLTRWNIAVLVTFPSLSNIIGKKSLIIWALHANGSWMVSLLMKLLFATITDM